LTIERGILIKDWNSPNQSKLDCSCVRSCISPGWRNFLYQLDKKRCPCGTGG
jgi:hypothetical protein